MLVSIGLQQAASGISAFSIPQLVDRILMRAAESHTDDVVQERFLTHVAEYGEEAGIGYRHSTEANNPSYSLSFHVGFFRCYEMGDEAIRVIRRDDVTMCQHVDVASIRFRVDLPNAVSLDNPIIGATRVAQAILGAAAPVRGRPD
ncbi:hypothetical protein StoSoilB3_11350 [Arthrobacter sp. StoSoilB3]|nr:hypothetical protein StoSoilB3_11350 [Arthrobacter sp. StoSoilB3]